MLLSSGDSFPHLIQKRRSQIGFVTYLLNYLCISTVLGDKPYEKLITNSLGITVNRVLLNGIGIHDATARIRTKQMKSGQSYRKTL